MPLPAWMKGHLTPRTDGPQPDMWNGKPLPARNPTHTNINYRLYDQRTGTLLSFNTTNNLNSLIADVLRTHDENPTARIAAVEYDGPAWTN